MLHVLIADADAPPAWPALDALLARLRPAASIEADDDSPATPLEIALARAHGLPGDAARAPWAAFESGTVGTPCAWFHPCHWQLGMDDARLIDPAALALTETESRALLAAAAPLLAESGVTLAYTRPGDWLAQGELLCGLAACSLRRALRGTLSRELLAQAPARLRRLQAELQMLLHDHPVNQQRERESRSPVNALWIDGAGALAAPCPPNPQVRVAQAGDAASVDELRRVLDAGGDARLTLCGPRRAITLAPARGWLAKITNSFRRQRFQDLRHTL